MAPAALARSQMNESVISSKIADALSVEAPTMQQAVKKQVYVTPLF